MNKGKLHLVPNILSEDGHYCLPAYLTPLLSRLKYFVVEEIKSARRLLKKLNASINIDQLEFWMLNEHQSEIPAEVMQRLKDGEEIAHTGPNSILLALMASGFNGQQFCFHGYLPNKQPLLGQKIQFLETESRQRNQSQIFIETPYRNQQLFQEILKTGHAETKLCIATDITGKQEKIIARKLKEWKNQMPEMHKVPTVFILYAGIH
jgi:16S rRNA (cytidine1402-2'-O)-methyltransferase